MDINKLFVIRKPYNPEDQIHDQRDLLTQVAFSSLLGLGAFFAFCFLRPRWKGLYAARKQQKDAAASLPELPDSFFGWIPVLYRITEEEVLVSAGLDAFVFLSFFRMAIKFLGVAFFFALTVMTPIYTHFQGQKASLRNGTDTTSNFLDRSLQTSIFAEDDGDDAENPNNPGNYLWMHVFFVYFFTSLFFYLLITETRKIIKVRQDYLGNQTTVTDRTIRLSGIPPDLRSEDKIQEFVERLQIGKVERVTLCRDWKEIDDLMNERDQLVRKLEEALTVYRGRRQVERDSEPLPTVQPAPARPIVDVENAWADEGDREALLSNGDVGDQSQISTYARPRPTTTIRFGLLRIQSRPIDAIDYHEERLRELDKKIQVTREKVCTPTPLAFVTLDSIAACQMAVQAILDPSPLQLSANLAPAPSDVVWSNTYVSRPQRMLRSWTVTMFVGFLTVFWLVLLVPVAALTDLDTIKKVLPGFGDLLENHKFLKQLISTQLTTLVVSLLSIAVPYLYDWLSNLQGMISQSEVELSVVSKNFFFTFFNLFLFFTILKSATLFDVIRDSLRDTSYIANLLANSLETTAHFYTNLIILQGLGLFPFKLLEFGSVALYPFWMMGAKTPRDYAELVQPPVFKYGFYLPQSILIFILCLVYAVLPPNGVLILGFGLVYFIIGLGTFKYQLLYAMDHRQHSTGRAWAIVSYRMILGVGVFQIAMAGWLALKQAKWHSLVVTPLIPGTLWFSYFYRRTYEPLTRYIALRSIRRTHLEGEETPDQVDEPSTGVIRPSRHRRQSSTADRSTVDEERERGMKFVNPNLNTPLEEPWIWRNEANGVHHRREQSSNVDRHADDRSD